MLYIPFISQNFSLNCKVHVKIFTIVFSFPIIISLVPIFALACLVAPFFAIISALLATCMIISNISKIGVPTINVNVFPTPLRNFFIKCLSLFDFIYYLFKRSFSKVLVRILGFGFLNIAHSRT